MRCTNCEREISENEGYSLNDKAVCEDCFIKAGLYPLRHTGSYFDKIAEKGRRLTVPDGKGFSQRE